MSRVAFVLAIVFTVRYFFWRALHTMNPAARIFFYAFLIAEILSFILRSEQFNPLKMHVLMRTLSGLFQKDSLFFVTRKARARAARASEVLFPLFLVVALLLALGAGMIRIQQTAWGGFYFWALAVNIFWAVVFVVMMGGVVRRSLRHKEQRVSYRSPTKAAAVRL